MTNTRPLKLVQITPGSGDNFYCENCLRDQGIVKSMYRQGHDAVTVPLYLPLQSDAGETVESTPIFFGGINVFLQQKFSLFRKTPRWLDTLFDWRRLLKWVSRKAGMTSGKLLGETTLSMLQGEDGRQVKELERLVGFLRDHDRPDVILLSNALLLGLVRRLKEALSVPVICLLQDEDTFVDGMPEPYRTQCWDVMTQRGREVDMFVPVSDYYARVMQHRLDVSAERMRMVRVGVEVAQYTPASTVPERPAIGFLSRQCEVKGLHLLVDAFLQIKSRPGLAGTQLRIAGGKLPMDQSFIDAQLKKVEAAGFAGDVTFSDLASLADKNRFLGELSVMCVPEMHGEACGLYVMEAAAAGVPSVLPDNGVFPELIQALGGGVLYAPNDAQVLADALADALGNPEALKSAGDQCRASAVDRFSMAETVQRLVAVCREACD